MYELKLVNFRGEIMAQVYKRDYEAAYGVLNQYLTLAQDDVSIQYAVIRPQYKNDVRVYFNSTRLSPLPPETLLLSQDVAAYEDALEAAQHTYLLLAHPDITENAVMTVPFVDGRWQYDQRRMWPDWVTQDRYYMEQSDYVGVLGFCGNVSGEWVHAARHSHIRLI